MIKQPYILNRGFCILLLFAFLQACSSSPGDVQTPPAPNGETEIAPTNTPFQPSTATSTSTLEVGTLSSATSDPALPSPTNPSDIASPDSVPTTQPPSDSTAPPPGEPPSVPTNTPDIPTPPPPGDPHIAILPYNITVGGILQIILTDFAANENVTLEVYLKSDSYQLQNSFGVTVNSDGDLTFNWAVPQSYVVGNYTVLAIGQTYGKTISGLFRVR